jgi:DNA-binding transcriptional LysR family regulator
MELAQARYFLSLAKTLNFTRAAEACNVTQPALTRAIQRLEDEFGGPLLHRERNLTQLTELGRQVLPLVEQTFSAAETAKALAIAYQQRKNAPLRLGLAPTISVSLLAPVLAELQARLAGFELALRQAPSEALFQHLLDAEIDAAVLVEGARLPERLNRWPLFAERYVVLCPPAHRFAAFSEIAPAALADEPLLGRVAGTSDIEQWFQALCQSLGKLPKIRHSVASEDHIQQMVAAGLGISLTGARQPAVAGLAVRPIADPGAARKLTLVVVGGRPHGPGLAGFLKLMRSRDWQGDPLPQAEDAGRKATSDRRGAAEPSTPTA